MTEDINRPRSWATTVGTVLGVPTLVFAGSIHAATWSETDRRENDAVQGAFIEATRDEFRCKMPSYRDYYNRFVSPNATGLGPRYMATLFYAKQYLDRLWAPPKGCP